MPRLKIDRIVSFSSADAENPCSNLLEPEVSRKKWLGQKGESSHSVVLQLSKCSKIQSVTIGSHHSALVEVLVGRSERQTDPFKVLVLSSIFMTPSESKREEHVAKVRTFQYEQLSAETRDESWDRIRVVCLQPYNKHVKYGLSFIHIFEPESMRTPESTPVSTDHSVLLLHSSQRFTISTASSDDEDSHKPGELFAKLKAGKLSIDAQIRQASKTSSVNSPSHSQTKLSRIEIKGNGTKNNTPQISRHGGLRDKDKLLYTDEEMPNEKIDKIINRDKEYKEKNRKDTKIPRDDKDRRSKDKERNGKDKERSSNDKDRSSHRESKENGDSGKTKTDNRQHSIKQSSSEYQPKNKDSGDRRSSDRKNTTPKNDRDRDKRSIDQTEVATNSRKRVHSDEAVNSRPAAKKLKAGPRASSPHRLMSDVVFVLSGYENPTRASIRDKALAMGAQYRRDWGGDCTHLICAFPNTPKLRTVRASDARAVIVTGRWVEACCEERRRLPWQWHATEPEHRVARGEDQDDDMAGATEDNQDNSEEDTEDEIERARLQRKDETNTSDRLDSTTSSDVTFVRDLRVQGQVAISDSDTDEYTEEENEADFSGDIHVDLKKRLPDFFEGYTFAVDPNMSNVGMDCNLIKRYIIAYSGDLVEHVAEDSAVSYAVSLDPACALRGRAPRARLVRPEWVWRCHRRQAKVSTKHFIVK